jgi:RimJ/RimL family protein N-acetyltransferase
MNVAIREVQDGDLPVLFEHQLEPEANRMAGFPPRDRKAFMEHWSKVRANDSNLTRTVLVDDVVAGNIGSWVDDEGRRLVGYWIGREFWGRGVATAALAAMVAAIPERPLFAFVAAHNVASKRVLEKCGFVVTEHHEPPPVDDGIEELLLRLDAFRTTGTTSA